MKHTLSNRLIRNVLLAILPILALIVAVVYTIASRELTVQTGQQARLLAGNTALKIQMILKPIADIPRTLASSLSDKELNNSVIRKLLSRGIRLNHDVFGMALGLQTALPGSGTDGYCPYVFRDGETIRFRRLDTPSYRYRQMSWYKKPFEAGRSMWSEPYFDKGGGNVLMSTFSVPVMGPDGNKLGIVTADISLKRLRDVVRSIKILNTGFAVLLSKSGRILVFRDPSVVMKETVFSLAKRRNCPSLAVLGKGMVTGESGEEEISGLDNRERYRVVYQPVPGTGWSVGIFLPERELLAPVRHLTRILLLVSLLGVLLVLGAVAFVARKTTAEIHKLSGVAQVISRGNLDVPVPKGFSTTELSRLADSFRTMQQSLQEHIQDLIQTTAAQERMSKELQIARDIQMGILPKLFPPFPSRHDLDLFAMIEPAREVGGDFYDFYLLDESHFCFVIGDVSGKGVPASLYMAVAKTLLKASAGPGLSPGEILEKVNKTLAEGNNRSMFVTVFMGILDLKTGCVAYANAGHNPPLLLKGDKVALLKSKSGIALGAWPQAEYVTESLVLDDGWGLYCYTDGVNEAFNAHSEIYGMDRMVQIVKQRTGDSAKAIVKQVFEDVKTYAGDIPQSDDITMLTVKWFRLAGSGDTVEERNA
ncbi:MAG: SpoIIE family protein phosphatase [Acidobacteria bacterium]|nr:SpoIIE family protein phosphatase [Acidobacteriota bacterium]